MSAFSLLPYGPLAWLVSCDNHCWLEALSRRCDDEPLPGFREWVMGYESLLLEFHQPISEETLRTFFAEIYDNISKKKRAGTQHTIQVHYNGPDLAEVAKQIQRPVSEVIRLHAAPVYTVRFLGFAPGFAYLDGLVEELILPRRAQPRPYMDPGALAIGGPHTGVYTVASPGGWNWLGNTSQPLFEPETELLLFHPGDSVRFLPSHA